MQAKPRVGTEQEVRQGAMRNFLRGPRMPVSIVRRAEMPVGGAPVPAFAHT